MKRAKQVIARSSGSTVHSPQSTAHGAESGVRSRPLETGDRGFVRGVGFTLIELLVVISVLAILASLVIPIAGKAKQIRIRTRARGDLALIQHAIESYHTTLGFYPPDNPGNPATNQLYYELLGTFLTNVNGGVAFQTLDGSAQIQQSAFPTVFGISPTPVTGFMNCTKGGGEEVKRAVNFLPQGLSVAQFLASVNPAFSVIGSSLAGPVMFTNSVGTTISPIWYNSTNPTNNPGSYDLWIDVIIGSKTNRVCNWSSQLLEVHY